MKLWARRGFEWAEDGLVGLWSPVSTGATQSILLDCNPSTNNHGTLINFSNLNSAWVGSQYGTVLDFDGSNDYVSFGNPSVVTSGRPFFVATWFRTTVNAQRAILAKSLAGGAANRFWLTTEVNAVGVNGELGGSGVAATFTTAYHDGNWHQLAGLYNGSTMSLFYDGVFRSSTTISQLGPSNYTLIAGKYNDASGGETGTTAQFHGQIAEVALCNRPWTRSEHLELFQAGPGGAWQLTPPSRRYATILANAYTLIAASASYSITGQPVGLLAGRLLTADAASYLLAGNATGLNAGRLLTADSAAYALNGQDANLLASRLLSGDTATYNLIGNSANLLASRTLQADSAQYTVTGSDAALLAGRLLDCGSSAFLLSPNQAGLLAARKLTADQASILLTTQATNLYAGRKITAETAQFILIASPVDLTFGGGGAAPYYYLFLLGGSR